MEQTKGFKEIMEKFEKLCLANKGTEVFLLSNQIEFIIGEAYALGRSEMQEDLKEEKLPPAEWIECAQCGDSVSVEKGRKLCYQCKEE